MAHTLEIIWETFTNLYLLGLCLFACHFDCLSDLNPNMSSDFVDPR